MKFPLHELRDILKTGGPTYGTVVALNSDGTARIATSRGGVLATLSGVAAIGDKVLIEGGIARRVQQVAGIYPL